MTDLKEAPLNLRCLVPTKLHNPKSHSRKYPLKNVGTTVEIANLSAYDYISQGLIPGKMESSGLQYDVGASRLCPYF